MVDRVAGLQDLPLRSQTMKHKGTEFCRESTSPSYRNCYAVAIAEDAFINNLRPIGVVRQFRLSITGSRKSKILWLRLTEASSVQPDIDDAAASLTLSP